MAHEITSCSGVPAWMRNVRLADIDDEALEVEHGELEQEGFAAVSRIPSDKLMTYYEEMSQQLANPGDWGKGGKRPIAVNPSAKRRAAKRIYEATKGWHQAIPLDAVFEALSIEGLVPVQEDGLRWQGMLMGGAECGSEEARKQYANIPIAGKNAEGKWSITTTTLHLQWCRMQSGKYEVVCYLS